MSASVRQPPGHASPVTPRNAVARAFTWVEGRPNLQLR
jgi:hypothetical protein